MVSTDELKVRRHPERGRYNKDELLNILRNGFVCQVAFQIDGRPFIIPMSYYTDSEYIYIHGSPVARISNTLRSGAQLAISVLEIDGLVLANGLADNSLNYRSAIIFGKPEEINDENQKLSLFKEWVEQLVPGRIGDTELPTHDELSNVSVFRVKLDHFSVKIRTGGPSEVRKNPEIWSGVIPISLKFSSPEFASNPATPEYIDRFIESRNRNGRGGRDGPSKFP